MTITCSMTGGCVFCFNLDLRGKGILTGVATSEYGSHSCFNLEERGKGILTREDFLQWVQRR